MKHNLFGFTGRKNSGKDTSSNHLENNHEFIILAFAPILKEMCGLAFGFNKEQLYGDLKEVPDPNWFNLTPRQVLQFVGTNLFRDHMAELNENFKNDFWILCVKKNIEKILKTNPNAKIVISDVRFPNEVAMVKELGGVVIRVTRPSLNYAVDTHISETLIDDLEVDYDILNDTTLDDLYVKIDDILLN